MNTPATRQWDQRRFISCSVLIFGLALPITGIGNHLARHASGPHAGPGWVVAHVAVGALFVFFAAWHVVLNRRALSRYLRDKVARPPLPSREILAALVLVAVVLALALT